MGERGEYLLDLVLTDVEALVKTNIVPKIADHNGVLSSVQATVDVSMAQKRKVFQYSEANWDAMKDKILSIDWCSNFGSKCVEEQVDYFTDFLLGLVHEFIPTKWITEKMRALHGYLKMPGSPSLQKGMPKVLKITARSNVSAATNSMKIIAGTSSP